MLVTIATLASCSWFPESTFTISPESRLPRWITLNGVSRSDVTLRVDFIVPLITEEYARVTVVGRDGNVRERIDASETSSVGVQTANGAPARGEYPNYQVVAVNGVTDIFEQRAAQNVLYMCDEAAVWSKLAPGAKVPPSVK